jgi:AcrR family transcriptional regulator
MSENTHQPGARGAAVSADQAEVVSDGRRLRGARSRRMVLRHAVDVASLHGLAGVSFGGLASDLEVSKSGIQVLFGTKESLQLATAEFARQLFHEAVIRPTRSVPPGAARLRALIDRWIEYAQAPLFPGGCFWAANLADFDSWPGAVHDTLVHQQRGWRELIAAELRSAADAGEIAELDVNLAAFQIDAVLTAANTAMRLGDRAAAENVRRVVEGFLTPTG